MLRQSMVRTFNVLFSASRFSGVKATRHLPRVDGLPRRTFTTASPAKVLRERIRSGVPNVESTSIVAALKACYGHHPELGAQIHGFLVSSGLDAHLVVSNSLMSMYSRFGRLDLARRVLDYTSIPDIVSWNTILSGFVHCHDALAFLAEMHRDGIVFDSVTFASAFASASSCGEAVPGMQLHVLLLKQGLDAETVAANALLTMYRNNARQMDALAVFEQMPNRDLVSWNALISGYTQDGSRGLEAIHLFGRMAEEITPANMDHISFYSVISACGQERCLEVGKQIHSLATKVGVEAKILVSNVLVSMYSKCGLVKCAKKAFQGMSARDVFSWTTIISTDVENAVIHFKDMLLDEVQPNEVTFVALIYAVSTENTVAVEGRLVHGFCCKCGFSRHLNVGSSLITMYARSAQVDDSRKVFDEMDCHETLSWNALISGYTQNNLCEDALKVFSFAILHSKPDQFTFGSVISAISADEVIPLSYGRRLHSRAMKAGLEEDEHVFGALINMYARRGGLQDARRLFDAVNPKTLVIWSTMISAYAMHGDSEVAMDLFNQILSSGLSPDHLVFLAVLTACSRSGKVDLGVQIFNSINRIHGLEPWREHYACVVDMLARAGRLDEAAKFLEKMPMNPGVSALQSLLSACRVHGNAEMGQQVADALLEIGPAEAGAFVLLSNIYAARGDWQEVARVKRGMRDRGVKKEVGFSWVDAVGESVHLHRFSSSDATHPKTEEIYEMAGLLGLDMNNLKKDGLLVG